MPSFRLPVALRLSIAAVLFFSVDVSAPAQEPDPVGGADRSAWFMYFGDHPVSQRWSVHLEGQFRREDLGQRWEQLLVRPGVGFKLGRGFSTLLAYTYLRGYPYEGGSLGDPSTTGPQPEHRALEELKYKHRLLGSGEKAVELSHRFRAEQRWNGTSTLGLGTTDWEFAERARYRLTADVPFRWNTAGALPDYTSVYNEIFVNFGPHGTMNALDQERVYGALGWNFNRDWQLEVGYLFQYQPTPSGIIAVQNHALQVTINSIAPFRRGLHRK